jgi:hypothetical protein
MRSRTTARPRLDGAMKAIRLPSGDHEKSGCPNPPDRGLSLEMARCRSLPSGRTSQILVKFGSV